eukprot:CAMPEP_0198146870 /NCGR_PEP_ID=MMETSP1443-20131203/31925_1 /TAXON_ID=186043 /ORGANISM="Entomoneis sp., Strain CCMP2396" /LENGTH=45 /DNA_ID= /DNA_START= /DNA_END= /DNA_ORIENTATION=
MTRTNPKNTDQGGRLYRLVQKVFEASDLDHNNTLDLDEAYIMTLR